jgi:hypothetical protein
LKIEILLFIQEGGEQQRLMERHMKKRYVGPARDEKGLVCLWN